MFHRFASALFGDDEQDDGSCEADLGFDEKEEENEWILVDYLAEACSSPHGEVSVGTPPQDELAVGKPPACCSSCSSLDDAEDDGFLQLGTVALEESWFVTPPPCFTASGLEPVLLETSPLEDLLIEHPSMSVYAGHLPRPALATDTSRSLDQSLLRVDVPRAPGLHAGCYAAALSAHAGLLEQAKLGRLAQRVRDGVQKHRLSRNALRRLNLSREGTVRQAKGSGLPVHQPVQRQFNY
uniref:Tumor protein p53 inducible nuclear protein 1 n=1 Tax=Paramormyrops kingsleyae TaxID=1676925 RepID=A0A3B3R6K8_9TELE|nr:tumor protein p53-inducible nuclear protein 1 [Paramormyrops kingsleyae]XP_023652271.1 tumor protein p53-inducible nuclear protein 1 [Paramormyrops kingsleyae]XP_023652272.1 tumor protein p53-inducible nuclear protein 1 [Paramormyrops kingsleyae]XP_023652274.1 tumor protein p53-inducible nuclear protein 1 [Paramormyrops kingsleyae]